jgi:hypothetical protein
MTVKTRLKMLESVARSARKFMRVQVFVFDGTDAQAAEIAKLLIQGIKIRLFCVVE